MSNEYAKELEWLYGKEEEEDFKPEIQLPTGGILRGMTAQWNYRLMFKYYTKGDIDIREGDHEPFSVSKTSNGTNWYFTERDPVNAAKDEFGGYIFTVWHVDADLQTVLGFRGENPIEEVFVNGLSYDIGLSTMRAGKSRHEFQFMTLPSLVQSMAILLGWLPDKIYDYDSLVEMADRKRQTENEGDTFELPNEEFTTGLIGGDNSFVDSELWQARAKIWADLDEANPKLYAWKSGTNMDVKSPKMIAIMKMLYLPGKFWARIGRGLNPKEEGYGVPLVLQIWRSKEEAEADIGGDEAGTPPLPESWTGATVGEWKSAVKGWLNDNQLNDKPAALVKAKIGEMDEKLADDLAAGSSDVIAWLDFI